jgi:hypothetical protein
MILNSQPQVSYALMDLMVKINAVNMEVFQVLHSSPFPHQHGLTTFGRKPFHHSVHPNFLHPPSHFQSQHQHQGFPPGLHTLLNSNNNNRNTKDTLPSTPVRPHIQTTSPRDTLLSIISNPLWHRGPKHRLL